MAFSTPTLFDPTAAPDGTLDGVSRWLKGDFFGTSLSTLRGIIRAAATTGGCFWRDPFGSPDQQAWVSLANLGADLIVLHLRGTGYATGPETGYAAYLDPGSGTVGFARVDGGVIGLIGVTTPASFARTDFLGASIVGGVLSIYKNDESNLLAWMTDRTYATGSTVGLQLFDPATQIGPFGGGPLAVPVGTALAGGVAPSTRSTLPAGTATASGRAPASAAGLPSGTAAASGLAPGTRSQLPAGTATAAGSAPGTSGPMPAGTATAGGVAPVTRSQLPAGTATANGVPLVEPAVAAPSIATLPAAERPVLQPGQVRVRHITPCASTDPGAVQVLGRYYTGSYEGINGVLGVQSGSFNRLIGDTSDFPSLVIPNGAGSDGQLHRDRLLIIKTGRAHVLPGGVVVYEGGEYRPSDEFFEIYADGEPNGGLVYVGTPTRATITRQSITLSGWDGFWLLKKTREFQAGFWHHAPRDVIEHYTGVWRATYADNMPASMDNRQTQLVVVANNIAALTPTDTTSAYLTTTTAVAADLSTSRATRVDAAFASPKQGGVGTVHARALFGIYDPVSAGWLAWMEIDEGSGDCYTQDSAEQGVQVDSFTITTDVQTAFAIEMRRDWTFFYANGTVVAVLPSPPFAGIAVPRLEWYAWKSGSGTPYSPLPVTSLVWRHHTPCLLRGSARGDLMLPGAPPPGGLTGHYYDGTAEVAKWPNMSKPSNSNAFAYQAMLGPGKDPIAIRTDPQVGFNHTAGSPWKPGNVPADNFAVRWTGSIYLNLAAAEQLLAIDEFFSAATCRVWVGDTVGAPVIDFPPTTTTAGLRAKLGTVSGWFPILIEAVYAGGGNAYGLRLWNGGIVVPSSNLSPYGIYEDQVRNDSHYDTLRAIADSFGYQLTLEPRSLESGEFPGRLVPRIRQGRDTAGVLDEPEAWALSDAVNAEGVADAVMADAAGVADPNGTGQLSAEVINFDTADAHLFLLQEYESLSEISQRPLLVQRLQSLLALDAAPWEEVSASPKGYRELLDKWPLPPTGTTADLQLFAWAPGDGIRLNFPSLGVIDESPRQIMSIQRAFNRNGLKPPTASFRQRPRSMHEVVRQLKRGAINPQRNYQGTLSERPGSLGSNLGGAAPDAFSRLGAPVNVASIVSARVVVPYKGDASTWQLNVNGATPMDITKQGEYDVTPWVGGGYQYATLNSLGAGSTGTWICQLIITIRI